MKYFAILLTLIVFIRHAADGVISEIFGITLKAAQYILSGFYESILCFVVGCLLYIYDKSKWRSLALGACFIGIVESMQISIFRILAFWKPPIPAGKNLADHVTGMPVGATLLATYMLALSIFFRRKDLTRSEYLLKIFIIVISSLEIICYVSFPVGIAALIICLAI